MEKETKLEVKTLRVSCPSEAGKLSKQQTPLGRLFPSRAVNLMCPGPLHRVELLLLVRANLAPPLAWHCS